RASVKRPPTPDAEIEPDHEPSLQEIVKLKLIESGEKERLKDLLRERLVECGWKDEMKALCRSEAVASLPMDVIGPFYHPSYSSNPFPFNHSKLFVPYPFSVHELSAFVSILFAAVLLLHGHGSGRGVQTSRVARKQLDSSSVKARLELGLIELGQSSTRARFDRARVEFE
ncbi:hypothetical protein F511_08239, partial [Dorcoceras hygrometricum]